MTDRERKIERSPEIARARQEIAETRARMSAAVSGLESRASEVKDEVKEKMDASRLVKEHPWPALAAAVVAGVALSATRADEKAADATVDAAKRGSAAAADGLRHAGEAVANRIHGDDGASTEPRKEEEEGNGDGVVQRVKASATRAVENQALLLKHELRTAAENIGRADRR